MTHASNVLGTVQPIEAIAPIVREAGALFLVDAAQSAGVVPIDLRETPIDLLAFPGHKALYGPTGTGALYVGPRHRRQAPAVARGGTGGDSSSPTQPTALPYFLEGGTPNVLGVAGLAAGIAWVAERGPESLRRHEVELLAASRRLGARLRWLEHRRPLGARHPRQVRSRSSLRRALAPGPGEPSSTPASTSPSGRVCTVRPTFTARSEPFPTARFA